MLSSKNVNHTFILINDISELAKLEAELELFCEENDLLPPLSFQLNLVLDELITNIISYGYESGESGTITVELNNRGDRIEITLSDNGKPFNPLNALEPDLTVPLEEREIGGLGVHFVREIMDVVNYDYRDNRNHLYLTKNTTNKSKF